MRGAKLFLEAAYRHGVRKAFGIVGGEAQAIRFNEVEGIDFYLTRHEFAAGIMADVYARISGMPQISYSTFGPGMTNLTTGVCSAMLDRTPMLAVSAQVPRNEIRYNQTHQCLDNAAIMAPMTKFSKELESAEEIPEVVTAALQAARRDVPGPSFISFPLDVMKAEVDDAQAERLLEAMDSSAPPSLPDPDYEDMKWLAGELARARRPIALAGNQVIREGVCPQLRQFLERYQMPLVTTLASKGILPEDHPLHIGPCNKYLDGLLKYSVLDELFHDCDLMLLIGYDFGEDVKPGQWQRNGFVRTLSVGPIPNPMGEVFQPDRELLGRLSVALPALTEMGPEKVERDHSRIARLKERKRAATAATTDPSGMVPVPAIVRSVREALGTHGILCSDIGLHKQYAGLFSETFEPNTFMCSNGCGTFGFGLPAGMGAKLAAPDRPVAVICGDGGFHSTSQDLETAARYGLPLVVVLLKDNAFGLIKYYQLLDRDPTYGGSVEFGDVDFVKLAQANGWQSHQITTTSSLQDRLAEAMASKRPTLLEVPIEYQYKFAAPTQ